MPTALHDTGYDDPVAAALIEAVQQEYIVRYGGRDETPVQTADFAPPSGAFVIVTRDGEPIGCGGLRRHDDGVAEIKRMFIRTDHRGHGHGRALLLALEQRAIGLGYRRMVLESGMAQPEALAVYHSAGYAPIAPYGIYRCEPDSRCFAKNLSAEDGYHVRGRSPGTVPG